MNFKKDTSCLDNVIGYFVSWTTSFLDDNFVPFFMNVSLMMDWRHEFIQSDMDWTFQNVFLPFVRSGKGLSVNCANHGRDPKGMSRKACLHHPNQGPGEVRQEAMVLVQQRQNNRASASWI